MFVVVVFDFLGVGVTLFMSSPLAVKQDIAVTIFVWCMCMCVSVKICSGHNFYIYAWISKQFGTIVVLEKKCHLNYFLGYVEGQGHT